MKRPKYFMQWTWGVFFCLKAVISLCSKQIHIYSCFIVYHFPTFLKTIGKKYRWRRKPSGQKLLKGVRRTYALKWGHSSEQFLTCYKYFRIISIAWKKLYFHWYFLLPQFSNFKQVNDSKAILSFWCRMPTYTLSNSQGITEDWKNRKWSKNTFWRNGKKWVFMNEVLQHHYCDYLEQTRLFKNYSKKSKLLSEALVLLICILYLISWNLMCNGQKILMLSNLTHICLWVVLEEMCVK